MKKLTDGKCQLCQLFISISESLVANVSQVGIFSFFCLFKFQNFTELLNAVINQFFIWKIWLLGWGVLGRGLGSVWRADGWMDRQVGIHIFSVHNSSYIAQFWPNFHRSFFFKCPGAYWLCLVIWNLVLSHCRLCVCLNYYFGFETLWDYLCKFFLLWN